MPNPIGVGGRVHDQESGIDGGAYRGLSRLLVEFDDRGQQLRICVAADGRQCRKRMAAGGIEGRDVRFKKFREKGRDGFAGQVSSNELLSEERVAVAAPRELVQ